MHISNINTFKSIGSENNNNANGNDQAFKDISKYRTYIAIHVQHGTTWYNRKNKREQ